MFPEIVYWILIFAAGACLGSFLNVCIYRLPLGKSILWPGSHCAACGAAIPWRHNIPILGWFFLKGRAVCCGTRIDFRYAVVEFLTAVGVTALWKTYPPALAAVYTLFFAGLMVATFVDVDHFIIPDEISLGGIVAGLALGFLIPELHEESAGWRSFLQGVWGFLFGGGLVLAIAVIGSVILRKEAMGMGDVKLMAMMGAFLGWRAPIFIIAVASFIGAAFGIALLLRKQKLWGVRMPFGPYLALAGALWLFGGREWMKEYLRMFF